MDEAPAITLSDNPEQKSFLGAAKVVHFDQGGGINDACEKSESERGAGKAAL
jgi:hypothetical protein